MRGGGAGSWGVVTSATFKTFPTFNVAFSVVLISTPNAQTMGEVAALHAKHLFDWGDAGQYYWVQTNLTTGLLTMATYTFFPRASVDDAQTALDPWLDACVAAGATVTHALEMTKMNINDALTIQDDNTYGTGFDWVLGSRLMPSSVYATQPEAIGAMYTKILEDAGPSAK
jgi:FAD/FMN-containing dehydrogenase